MYHKHYISNQPRIPGIVLLLIVAGILGTALLITQNRSNTTTQNVSSSHEQLVAVDRLDVVNVRDRSMTIYWRTETASRGLVEYGDAQDNLNRVAYDERDSAAEQLPRKNHIVQIKGLEPKSDVYFRVRVDNKAVGQSGQVPFSAKTTGVLSSTSGLEPVYGDIIRSSSLAEKDAVVILHIGDSMPLLARTNKEGTFLFSLCCVLSSQNLELMYPAEDDPVRLHIIAEDGTEKVEEGTFDQVQPLAEALVLDSNIAQLRQFDSTNNEAKVLAVSDAIEKLNPVDIVYPKEGVSIPGQRPLVRGVGEPGVQVRGAFPEMGRIFNVKVDDKRNWMYQPSFDFEPGQHTLEVETTNEFGKVVQLTRAFTILKSGEAVLGEATPSGTITPTATASATPTIEPTVEPTLIVTSVPTISATPAPPVSGSNVLPITLISLVLVVIGAGIVLLF